MARVFHVYIKSDKQPSMDSLARALSSRGFSFTFTDDTPLHERGEEPRTCRRVGEQRVRAVARRVAHE